jgi:hypothetical protein
VSKFLKRNNGQCFFDKFDRHNEEIALKFALIFDGSKAIVGEI